MNLSAKGFVRGISIAEENEWIKTKEYFFAENCVKFPYGEYFEKNINNKKVIFHRCNVRKTSSSAAAQYMIDKLELDKIIVIGTCAGIDRKFNQFDIIIPNLAPLAKLSFGCAIIVILLSRCTILNIFKSIRDVDSKKDEI